MTYFLAELNEAQEAIQRVRDLIENECYHDEANNKVVLIDDLVKALDGEQL